MTTQSRAGKTKNLKWRNNFIKIHNVIKRLAPLFGYDQESDSWVSGEKKLMLSVIELALIDVHNWDQVMMRSPSEEERKPVNTAASYAGGALKRKGIRGVDADDIKRYIKY